MVANAPLSRQRLVSTLHEILKPLNAFLDLDQPGEEAMPRVSASSLRAAAEYLVEAGLKADARRLVGYWGGLLESGLNRVFCDWANDGMSIEWLEATFGRFPRPAEDPAEQDSLQELRLIAVIGLASQMREFVAGLIEQVEVAAVPKAGPRQGGQEERITLALLSRQAVSSQFDGPRREELETEKRRLAAAAAEAGIVPGGTAADVAARAVIDALVSRCGMSHREAKQCSLHDALEMVSWPPVNDREQCDPPSESAQSFAGKETNKYAAIAGLSTAVRRAYLSFLLAEARAEKRLEDRVAYDWLQDNEWGGSESGELEDYELPEFDTWSRYLRTARKELGEQKYTPRSGRALSA